MVLLLNEDVRNVVNFWKKKKTKEILRNLLPLSKGETIESVIRKLADEVCQLRNSNINLLHQHDTAVQDISCLRDTLMELIPEEAEIRALINLLLISQSLLNLS
jgi:hypothetical protein